MLPHGSSSRRGRHMLSLRRIFLHVRMLLGYEPNVEWLRASLSRATLVDGARAHAAIVELERCVTLHRSGGRCRRFPVLR